MKFAERSDCPSCGSTDYRKVCGYDQFTAFRCRRCSLVFLNPYIPPESTRLVFESPEALAAFMPFCDNYFDEKVFQDPRSHTSRLYRLWLKRFAQQTNGRRLLEIGCGKGYFLRAARETGWDASGMDFENTAIPQLRSEGFQIKAGDFLDYQPDPGESYDVIALWDVFEHFPNPHPVIEKCKALLKPRGMLFIACPNEQSLLAHLAKFFYRISCGLLSFPAKVVYVLDHPVFYAPRSIRTLLESHQLKIICLEMDETDLRRVDFSPLTKIIVRIIFFLAKPFNLQNRLTLIAQKP